MIELHSRIQPYAWGSRHAIARLQGRPVPSATPEAELWLGAHPSAPSCGPDGAPLTELIAAAPATVLGPSTVDRFGARLPYLMKVLAAAEPLSLQAHPDAAQAVEGYARDPDNYVDPYHKPELLVALDEFEALCGFADPGRTADALDGLGVPELAPLVAALRIGLRPAVEYVLGRPADDRAALVEAATAHPLAASLAKRYPGDIGVVLALLLNHVRLAPGQAIYMPAGNLHAYLSGVAVEIMAASDNVLRGGLTTKRVDVAALLRVLRYEVLDDPVVAPVEVAPGLLAWRPPVDDFALYRATLGAGEPPLTLPGAGPRIVLCVDGTAVLTDGGDEARLDPGAAVFVPASAPPLVLTGPATVFQASPG